MKKINPNRIKFYEFLNGDIEREEFENYVYANKELETEFPQNHYIDLISYPFESKGLKPYLTKLVKTFFNYEEYELWRTIKLLQQIEDGKIEIVLATRKLRKLYIEQEEVLECPLITIKLGIGFESVLDECPIEDEYHNWNSKSLKKQLEPIEWYRDDFLKNVSKELNELAI